jgi:hypothetical protein
MNPLRPYIPCESVCQNYADKCGKPRELVCAVFGDPDDPDPRRGSGPIDMCKGVPPFPRSPHAHPSRL